jgi:hypothetical protein
MESEGNYMEIVKLRDFVVEFEEYVESLGGSLAIGMESHEIYGTTGIDADARQEILNTLGTIISEMASASGEDADSLRSLVGSYFRYFRDKSQEQLNRVN